MAQSKFSLAKIRVILYMDMDSWEIQNQMRHVNLSRAVVAINSDGLVLSATKSAKELGITRLSTLDDDDQERLSPLVDILTVPDDKWGKPDSKPKRIWSYKIMRIIEDFACRKGGFTIEMNSMDDTYLDVTFVATRWVNNRNAGRFSVPNLSSDMRLEIGTGTMGSDYIEACLDGGSTDANTYLMMGAILAQQLAKEIIRKTGFKVSFGIGRNKTLAKIAALLHRPRGITILAKSGFNRVTDDLPIGKITGLAGDRGEKLLDEFGDDLTISDLREIPYDDLEECIGFELAQKVRPRLFGYDGELVEQKTMSKSISCRKTLRFNNNEFYIKGEITNLCEEMIDKNVNEEVIFHQRIGVRFRMEVESWYACHPNYSYTFEFTPSQAKYADEDDFVGLIVQGLRDDGFKFGSFYAKKLSLSVTKFADSRIPCCAY